MDPRDFEEDHDADDVAPVQDLRTLPTMKGFDQALTLEIDYLPNWIFRDCFREVCQNWSDGIKETNKLENRNFVTVIMETKIHWLAKAQHPDTGVLLGFIRYLKRKGMVELTNFNAQLARRSLNFGGGDKQKKSHLAGGNGEGYKAAAIVALKGKYQFRYEASKCYWRFHVGRHDPEQIYCELKPMRPKALEKAMKEYVEKFGAGSPRDETSYIHQDVSVKIGNVYDSDVSPGTKITEELFRECIKVSLDLFSPLTMIMTPDGELIVDGELKDKTYLKRLLVDGNPGISKYSYGYHFFDGRVDRDRRRTPNTKLDASRVAKIWDCVIKKHPEYLVKYIEMIEDETTQWADVHLAKDYVSEDVAEKMSLYYFDKDADRHIFYHDSRNGDKEIEIITRSLKKTPQQLVGPIWDILRKYHLVRTPQEQQERLLKNAPEAVDNGTPYSKSVKRALRAALRLDPRTRLLRLSFRSGAKAELDLLLCGPILNINEKWLDFHASHEKTPCCLSRTAPPEAYNTDRFSCHHVVLRLHKLVLEELARRTDKQHGGSTETDDSLHQRVRENLSQMPIMVEANARVQPGEIEVSWTDLDFVSKLHGLNSQCRVIVHRESTCSHVRDDLLTPNKLEEVPPLEADGTAPNAHSLAACGCPEQIVSQKDGKAVFHGLEPTEEYFPMVARTDTQAFFGLPPKAVRPKVHQVQLPSRTVAAPALSPPAPRTASPKREGHENDILSGTYDNLYDDSTSDDNEINMGMDPRRPSSQSSVSGSDNGLHSSGNITLRSYSKSSNNSTLTQETRDVHRLRAGSGGQRKQLAAKDEQLENFKAEIEGLRDQLAAKDEDLRTANSGLNSLRQQLSTANDSKDEIERVVTRLRDQIDHLNSQLQRAVARGDRGEKLIREEKAETEAQSVEVNIKDRELLMVRREFKAQTEKLDNMKACLEANRQELQMSTAEVAGLRESLESLNTDIRTKEEELRAANTLVENLQRRDEDATVTIANLRGNIRQLQAANEQLEADLDMAQDVNDKQARLAANRAARTRASTGGMKPEIKEEDEDDSRSGRPSKRLRRGNVTTTRVEGHIVID